MTAQQPGLAPQGGTLDLVNVAGEVARRAQAKELGASVVTALFRLVKLATLHALDNQAVVRQIDETVAIVNEYGQRTEHNVSILFAHGSVFVGGLLLRANRGVYEGALELGQILERVGAAEIGIMKDVKPQDFYAFVSAMAEALRNPRPPRVERPSPRIRMRGLSASALGREIAVEKADSKEDPRLVVARTYASAIVIMRRFLEAMRKGRYELPQRVKRVAQRLVDLAAGETPAFLGVTSARNQNHDEAGRAVNSAILALAMARQIDLDPVALSRVAMASLLADCATARLAGVAGQEHVTIVPKLSEFQDDRFPAGTAVVLTALGRVNEPSIVRTVVTYESHWIRREKRLGPLYRGLRPATLHARIVALARAFNDLVTPETGAEAMSSDDAIQTLEGEVSDNVDRTVLRLLVGALGMFPTGTLVELSTGEVALVVKTPSNPAAYSAPRVRVVLDPQGATMQRPVEVDLAVRPRAGETPRHIRRVVATCDDPAAAGLRQFAAAPSPAERMTEPPPNTGSLRDPARQPPGRGSGVRGADAAFHPDHVGRGSDPRTGSSGVQSGPYTPISHVPSSVKSVGPTLASQFSRPSEPPRARPVDIQEAADEAYAIEGNATRAMTSEDAAKLLSSRAIEEEETHDRRSSLPPAPPQIRQSAAPSSPLREARIAATVRPGSAEVRGAPSVAPDGTKKATAEGTLAKTPLVHLLVYMLDQRLTGTTILRASDGVEHAVLFEDGAPVKIRTGAIVAPLDRVILDHGLLDAATLSASLLEVSKRRMLHGRYLVGQNLLDRETVLALLRLQLVRKLEYLFELPADTRYAYYEGENFIADYGGPELLPVEPLAVIMAGVRLRAGDPVVDATLARVAGRPLAVHRDAELRRFDLHRDELAVAELLRARKVSSSDLMNAGVAQERVVKTTLYALAITRSLDLGSAGRPPVGIGRAVVDPPRVTRREAEFAVEPPAGRSANVDQAAVRSANVDQAAVRSANVDESPSRLTNAPRAFGIGFGRPVSAPAPASNPAGPSSSPSGSLSPPTPVSNVRNPAEMPPGRPTTKMQRTDDSQIRTENPRTPLAPIAAPAPPPSRVAAPAPQPSAPSRVAAPAPQPSAPSRVAAPAPAPQTPPPAAARWVDRRAEIEQRASVIEAQNFFDRLGVKQDAAPEVVQATYFALAKTWHPDRLSDDLSDLRPQVARVFAKLNEAYHALSDPKKRADHVHLLKQGGTGTSDDDEKIQQVVDAALQFQKAEILLKKNDFVGAETLAQLAVKGDPDQPDYRALHVWIQALRRGDPPPLAEGQVSSQFDDLIRTLDGLLNKEPRFERALFYRGSLLKRSGRAERAIRDFRLAAEVNPKNIDAVREVRLHEMRKRGGGPAPKSSAPPEGGGLLNKLWKR